MVEDATKVLILTVLLVSPALDAAVPQCSFPAIYNFGDSNSDTGGSSAAFDLVPPPNGESFFGRPAGRECDGRLIIDFIAEHLGLPYLNPYLDWLSTSYRQGVNFAAGRSTIRGQNKTMVELGTSPFSLDVQIAQFDQFKAKASKLQQRESNGCKLSKPQEFSRALYTFDIGENDLIAGLRMLTEAQLLAAIPNIIDQLAAAVTHLYRQGARSFWIHNTGPVGCLPAATFNVSNPKRGFLDKYGCISGQNAMAIEYNRQLKGRVIRLRKELPQASLVYVDVYSAKYHLISNAKNYGFMDPMKICCGHHERNISVWCGQRRIINGLEIFGTSCDSPESHISWNGLHYTQAANQWIADRILDGSFSDPPTPIAKACLM
ncbi:GDSL esterase/lipase At5g14450-like [Andrographis paniculata]|uniref:GDSL esterase/lipase At5g14450-like n=1 Tax=Andrographis paniculata TaxID=175694 RepID=UPI0021E77FD2|nr:GDSL esterase/lipase At5g14450-like [Andrographis paniculata]